MKKKILNKYSGYAFFFFSLLFCFNAVAQSTVKWKVNFAEADRVFVENKGQFNGNDNLSNSNILYGTDDGGTKKFFSPQGLSYCIYKIEEPVSLSVPKMDFLEDMSEEEFEREALKTVTNKYFVHMNWLNANLNPAIVEESQVSHYFNYSIPNGENVNFVHGFKKITYKELYPNVDVEYTFHEGKGLEYALVLKPGADVSKIKMQYTGASNVELDKDGNIHVSSLGGDIIDHAPITYYGDDQSPIVSSFTLDNNTVSFKLSNYNPGRPVVVDPWTTDPSFASYDQPMEIDRDKLGNVYVYGSDNNLKLRKYNSAGVVQWTYNTGWATSAGWFGNLAVDSAGNSYISTGSANATIKKVNTAGTSLYSATGASGVMELFHLCFSLSQPNSIGLIGAQPPGACGAGYVNTTTGAVSGIAGIAGATLAGENRGLCASKNGNFYTLTTNNVGNTYVIGFTYSLVNVFSVLSGYGGNIPYNSPAYKGWAIPGTQNSIAASACFVYTYDGSTLKKWDGTTGALKNTVVVAGGTVGGNSGIYVDECETVYVGTGTGISVYDWSMNFVSSTPTASKVYDVMYNYNTNEIIACGNAFVASLAISYPCTPAACGAPHLLPVELLSFNAKVLGNQVKLDWKSASEKNNSNYLVERSKDGNDFEAIGNLKGHGNSSSRIETYELTDNQPYSNTSYYRLKEIDNDGKFKFSSIVSANVGVEPWQLTSARFTENDLELELNASSTEKITVKIFDTQGRLIQTQKNSIENIGENKLELEHYNLPAGVYFISVESNDFVKQIKAVKL